MLMVLLCRLNSARSRLCEDSQEYTLYWPARLDTVPRKPDELYFLPENFGASDLLQPVSPEKLDEARMKYKTTDSKNDFQEYFNHFFVSV